ncbi:MAG TPA: hypothetical protein VG518_05140 [Solirubrobacterales bacterium]|nr:hypothetical protein [Solirubrobacterales bacterium]
MRSRLHAGELGSRRAAALCLAVAATTSWALLLALDSHLTFIADDWELLVRRAGWSPGVFLAPFHEHIVVGPALLYRALLQVFGMGSALPFYVVSTGLFILSAVLLFAYLRRRIGDWAALVFVVPVLFLGAGAEDLLWAFQMGFFGSMAAGLGMLLALDRDDRRGDRLACALLLVSIAFSSVGLAFAAAALADLVLGRRPRSGRAYVAAVPIAAYALWWAGWGHTAESHLSLDNLLALPLYVFDSIGAGIAALLGREVVDPANPGHPPLLFRGLAAVAIGAGALRVSRQGGVSRGLAVALALALAFWGLAGLNHTFLRPPTAVRYQYPSAVFLLLIAAEALRGVRITRPALLVLAALATVSVLGGISLLRQEYRLWESMSDSVRATLAAVDIAGPRASGMLPSTVFGDLPISAHRDLEVAGEHGSPGFSESELLADPESRGALADPELAAFLGIALRKEGPAPGPPCRRARALDAAAPSLALGPGGFELKNASARPVGIELGRFSREHPIQLGELAPGAVGRLAIARDGARRPWRLSLDGGGPVRLCAVDRPGPS